MLDGVGYGMWPQELVGPVAKLREIPDSAVGSIGLASPDIVGQMKHVSRTEDRSSTAVRFQQGRPNIGGADANRALTVEKIEAQYATGLKG